MILALEGSGLSYLSWKPRVEDTSWAIGKHLLMTSWACRCWHSFQHWQDFSECHKEVWSRFLKSEFIHTDFKHSELEMNPGLSPVEGFTALGSVYPWSYSGPRGLGLEKFGEGGCGKEVCILGDIFWLTALGNFLGFWWRRGVKIKQLQGGLEVTTELARSLQAKSKGSTIIE